MKRNVSIILPLLLLLFLFAPLAASAQATPKQTNIAIIDIQELMTESKVGRAAREKVMAKNVEFQTKLMAEQQQLEALREEINKRGSVWSEAVRNERLRDFEQKKRELQIKSEDMRQELQQLEMDLLEPIRVQLEEVIAVHGKKNGYTLILDSTRKGLLSRTGLLYADVPDISDKIRKELDSRMSK
jgi:outer membrane protein